MRQEDTTLESILQCGLIPVIRTDEAGKASRAADAIMTGGVTVIEITMTVPGALKVLEALADRYPGDILLGAGTVLDAETARMAILAGARFIVSPSMDRSTVEMCRRYGTVSIPGALTPTEILRAWQWGATMVKVFPVNLVGGPSYLKAIKAPLPQISMVPTGGVTLENAAAYIKAGASALGVGSALISEQLLEQGSHEVLAERARRFLAEIRKAREG